MTAQRGHSKLESGKLSDGQRKEAHMTEQSLIQETPTPRTRESLAHDLRALGVEAGMTLEGHSSLSKLRWDWGGPVAVVRAFIDVVTDTGTLVMPTPLLNYNAHAQQSKPPVPQSCQAIPCE